MFSNSYTTTYSRKFFFLYPDLTPLPPHRRQIPPKFDNRHLSNWQNPYKSTLYAILMLLHTRSTRLRASPFQASRSPSNPLLSMNGAGMRAGSSDRFRRSGPFPSATAAAASIALAREAGTPPRARLAARFSTTLRHASSSRPVPPCRRARRYVRRLPEHRSVCARSSRPRSRDCLPKRRIAELPRRRARITEGASHEHAA